MGMEVPERPEKERARCTIDPRSTGKNGLDTRLTYNCFHKDLATPSPQRVLLGAPRTTSGDVARLEKRFAGSCVADRSVLVALRTA